MDPPQTLAFTVKEIGGGCENRTHDRSFADLPVVRVDGAVRFKEEDVLRLLTENQGPKPRLLSLSSSRTKS
jgi:hypothetical protein